MKKWLKIDWCKYFLQLFIELIHYISCSIIFSLLFSELLKFSLDLLAVNFTSIKKSIVDKMLIKKRPNFQRK